MHSPLSLKRLANGFGEHGLLAEVYPVVDWKGDGRFVAPKARVSACPSAGGPRCVQSVSVCGGYVGGVSEIGRCGVIGLRSQIRIDRADMSAEP